MKACTYHRQSTDSAHPLNLVCVEGTAGQPFLFDEGNQQRFVEVPRTYIAAKAWEWCQDCHPPDTIEIPADGSPFVRRTDRQEPRSDCFHNWAIHCTGPKRHETGWKGHNDCIGLRLVLTPGQ